MATASDSGSEHLSNITLEMELPCVRLDDGDLIIHLGNGPDDILVVHSKVLATVSPRYRTRFGDKWANNKSTTVQHSRTNHSVKTYYYRLIYNDGAFVLTDEDFPGSSMPEPRTRIGTHFHTLQEAELELQDSIIAHKIAFALLYQQQVVIDVDQEIETTIRYLTNVIALAEFYDLLPAIAPQLEALILEQPGLWKDISIEPIIYIAIGKKLRSTEIFSDAMRHYVGRGYVYQGLLENEVLTHAEVAVSFLPSQQCHQGGEEDVMKRLRELAFTRYQAHATASYSKQGRVVGTTWLAATLEKRTVDEKCEFLAKSAFRKYLDHQLYGESHWSHVKYCTTNPKNGDVVVGSFRKMCEAVVQAWRAGCKLEIFGARIAAMYAGIFELKQVKGQPHPASLIAKYLRILVARAAKIIGERMPEKDAEYYPHGNCANCDIMGPHERAKFDKDLKYSTCMGVGDMPWVDEAGWDKFDVSADDLRDASNEWLKVVGVLA